MSSSARPMITSRLNEVARIIKIAETHSDEVCRQIEQHSGAPRAQTQQLIREQVRHLQLANSALEDAYDTFEKMRRSSSVDFNHRAADELERVLWHAQGRISEPFGPEILRLYGLEDSPPAGYRALATYAHNAVTLLQTHPQSFEGQFGDNLDTSEITAAIRAPLFAMDDYLATLDAAPPEFKRALEKRDVASDHWMRVWRGSATILEGTFLLAGRGDLAANIRPVLPSIQWHNEADPLLDIDQDDIERASSI